MRTNYACKIIVQHGSIWVLLIRAVCATVKNHLSKNNKCLAVTIIPGSPKMQSIYQTGSLQFFLVLSILLPRMLLFPVVPEPPPLKYQWQFPGCRGGQGRGWEGLDEGSSWLVALVETRGLYRSTSLPTALVSPPGGDARIQSSCGAV